jgi:hypothetical protein
VLRGLGVLMPDGRASGITHESDELLMSMAPIIVFITHLSDDLLSRSLLKDSLTFTRPVFPLPVEIPMVGLPWAFSSAAHRPVTSLAVRVGTGFWTLA